MNLRQRIDRFATEEAELRKEMQQYRDLVSRGILGPAQRMKWIEGIHEIRRRRHLRALHYEFAPQQDLALPVPIPATKPFQFVTTPVQLTLLAVHEGEVIGLLDDLGERIPAYVRPRRCLLERKRSEKPGASSALQMDCQMDWITITHTP
ncbi:MAG TPA: hypothetical protein VFW68_04420 [Rhodocyclaceae bacterium]|nr:hypothetical protein [Rhodocyclaceae bacterium]